MMRLLISFIGGLISVWVPLLGKLSPHSAVTYTLSGGRFGDNLLALSHAAWVAHCLDLPLVYHPFPYAEKLSVNQSSEVLKNPPHQIEEQAVLRTVEDYCTLWRTHLSNHESPPTLITVPYYPETEHDLKIYPDSPMITQVNWDDPQFIEKLRALLRPLEPPTPLPLPVDRLCVALHIRTGRGFDDTTLCTKFPLKSPPLSYYFEALNRLLTLTDMPLYVHIFSDDPTPLMLKHLFECKFRDKPIVFSTRAVDNHYNKNVLEDFFSLASFDCFIRSGSNFSLMADRLFGFKLLLAPVDYTISEQSKVTVHRILLQIRPEKTMSTPIRTILRLE